MFTQTAATVASWVGDYQPVAGNTMRMESGLETKSAGIIIAPCSTDVEEDDLAVLVDGRIFYVNYVRRYEDHTTIYLRRTTGQDPADGASWDTMPDFECGDLAEILVDWKQLITVKRSTASYNASGAEGSRTLATLGSFYGDWQPVSGQVVRAEAGLEVKSVAVIIAPCNVNLTEDDQIVLPDATIYYVNYVRDYEDHTTVYLKRTTGQTQA